MDPGNPIGEALNTRPTYVASTTLTDPQWAGTTVLSGDVAAAVGELRAEPGGELQVWGSGTLIRWLFDHRLVDEIILLTYPVIVGQGRRSRRRRADVVDQDVDPVAGRRDQPRGTGRIGQVDLDHPDLAVAGQVVDLGRGRPRRRS